jgi:hypothetical protein
MPKIETSTGKTISVSSKVNVGAVGSPRWRAYCARSGQISGKWKKNPDSPNNAQRYRWRCPPVEGETRGKLDNTEQYRDELEEE